MQDLGHLIATLLEAEASSTSLDDVVDVSSPGARGRASEGQGIESAEGGKRWIPLLWESRALAPRSEAVCLCGARG